MSKKKKHRTHCINARNIGKVKTIYYHFEDSVPERDETRRKGNRMIYNTLPVKKQQVTEMSGRDVAESHQDS